MRVGFVVFAAALSACATATEVVPVGDGVYLVASEGVIGNGSAATQLVKATSAANTYCARDGKRAQTIDSTTMDPGFGRAPGATVRFRCS